MSKKQLACPYCPVIYVRPRPFANHLKRVHPMSYVATDPVLKKVAPDEPIFVLRAQDMNAPTTIRFWVKQAEATGCPSAKLEEALACADLMEQWPNRKWPD